MGRVPSYHRGALALRYSARTWPEAIAREFDALASVVVRLECALHPAVGLSTAALEAASVARLEEDIRLATRFRVRKGAAGRERPQSAPEKRLARLLRRALTHVDLAHRALARVRGDGPSVVPVRGAR
jgi:hypothetical protein